MRRCSTPSATRSASVRAAACRSTISAIFRRIVRRDEITIAVVAVPAAAAQTVVNTVVAAGIKAILNFSPGALQVPPDVKLKSVDLTVSLESLSFFLAQGEAMSQSTCTCYGYVRHAMHVQPVIGSEMSIGNRQSATERKADARRLAGASGWWTSATRR